MSKKYKCISAISLTLSVISIILAAASVATKGLETPSLLVGILAIMTTVLIAWQIYVLMDMKDYVSRFDVLSDSMEKEKNRQRGISNYSYASSNIAWITKTRPENWFIEYVKYALIAVTDFSRAQEFNMCWTIIDELIDNIKGGDKQFYNSMKEKRSENLNILQDVEGKENIKNFNALLKLISDF